MPPAPWSPRPEDPLVVGHDDEAHVLERPLAEQLGDPVAVGRRDPRAARPPDDVAELLAGAARRSACRRSAGTPRGDRSGAGRRGWRCGPGARRARCTARAASPLTRRCSSSSSHLLLDRQHPVGQQTAQAEGLALVGREGELLGQEPAAEQGRAGEPDRPRVDRRRCRRTGSGKGRIPARIAVGRDARRDDAERRCARDTRGVACERGPRTAPQTPSDGARDRASPASGAVRSTRRS